MVRCNKAVHKDPYPGHVGQLITCGSPNICQQLGNNSETSVRGNYLNCKKKNKLHLAIPGAYKVANSDLFWRQKELQLKATVLYKQD